MKRRTVIIHRVEDDGTRTYWKLVDEEHTRLGTTRTYTRTRKPSRETRA